MRNPNALHNIERFTIHELSFNPSAHFPVVASCNFPLRDKDVKSIAASDLLTTASESCIKRTPKINPSNVDCGMHSKIAVNELRRLPELNHDSSQS